MPASSMSISASTAVERPKSTFEDVTWKSFLTYEPELNALADSKYRHLASGDTVEKTKEALEERGFKVHVVNNKDEAFQKVVSLIPAVAITETGEIAHGDQTGTKVGGVSFGAGNVIVVAGTNKIVKDEAEAVLRTKEFCLPFVSAYSRRAFKIKEAFMTNYEVLRATQNGRIQVVLVKEVLGF
ncbi:hypothetical protein BGZ97_012402 [Linnemannia gamsii]|uniref:LUD domain-containing protein n=1 Tax=Linnemannia gamsii TaxID=64522 RepID=A0A9P6ULM4_9FUNG|nr:hypothetical protein BGZ97_012402 [Linnemannia gamsii]